MISRVKKWWWALYFNSINMYIDWVCECVCAPGFLRWNVFPRSLHCSLVCEITKILTILTTIGLKKDKLRLQLQYFWTLPAYNVLTCLEKIQESRSNYGLRLLLLFHYRRYSKPCREEHLITAWDKWIMASLGSWQPLSMDSSFLVHPCTWVLLSAVCCTS